MTLIDKDELLKQAYKSGDWDRCEHPMVVDVVDIEDAPTIDQWHYPSKGEYPTDGEETLIMFKHRGEKVFKVDKYSKQYNGWQFSPKPIAWQYIVPPKEEV